MENDGAGPRVFVPRGLSGSAVGNGPDGTAAGDGPAVLVLMMAPVVPPDFRRKSITSSRWSHR